MKLLRDEAIVRKLQSKSPPIHDVPQPVDWYAKDSPVQPSSLDLHVGDICLPIDSDQDSKLERNVAMDLQTKEEHILEPGHTAVVVSLERIELPSDLAAFGFPPSRMSFQGLLMTNPGHIDPGYNGHMRFTIINMGKKNYVLRKGDAIITLLLFELDKPARNDWLGRRPGINMAPNPSAKDLSLLPTQFMDIDTRARSIIKKFIGDAEFRIRVWTPIFAGLAGAVATLLLALGNHLFIGDRVDDLKHEMIELKEQVKLVNFEDRLRELEDAINNNPEGGK